MIPEVTFLSMSNLITIHLFDRIWFAIVSFAILLFLLPFSVLVYDILYTNIELWRYRFMKSMSEIFQIQNVNFFQIRSEELTNFHYKYTKRNEEIVHNILHHVGHYLPPWWYSSHLGTLVAFGYDPQLVYESEMVKSLYDEDSFQLSWYPRKPTAISKSTTTTPTTKYNIIVYFPGLGLTSRSVSDQSVLLVINLSYLSLTM